MVKLRVKNLYKIFGSQSKRALKMLKEKKTKDDVLNELGVNVGVDNATFDVEEGTIFVVMGLSGSGKSTLIRCLNRLIEPTEGSIIIDDTDILELNHKEFNMFKREKLGMVFQSFALLPHKNVIDNVAFGLEIQGLKLAERREEAQKALKLVGLDEYAYSMPDELSGGMKQRVGLARALATNPDILLMDEAFSALDPLIRKKMQSELLALQDSMHKTIIFITHDLDEALALGDNIAIMKDGAIVQIGTAEEILSKPANKYVSDFTQNINRAKVLTASGIMHDTDYLVLPKDGVRSAMQKMKKDSISSMFVLDKEKKLKGIVNIEKALESVKANKENLSEILDTDIKTVHPDTLMEDIMPLFQESKYPVAVVDENNKFKGIIFKASVLAGIIGGENNEA